VHLSDALIRNALVCTNLIFIKVRMLKMLHNPSMRRFPIAIAIIGNGTGTSYAHELEIFELSMNLRLAHP